MRTRRASGVAGAMSMVPTYQPRASALHSARAGVAAAFCCALALAAALYANPLALAGVLAATALAGIAAGVGRELWLAARLALPFALLVALVNPIVYQGGDTLLLRGGEVLGRRIDITLEATVQGGLAGLRVAAIILAFGLLSAAVDPDELLRLFRRLSYRSALTASLATRLVPVLERDALRRGDAARCRPEPPGRLATARLVLAGTLDRAVDMAAALEVRGYALAGRPARRERVTWSRHDVRVGVAAVAIAAVAVGAKVAGAGGVDCYPRLDVDAGSPTVALMVALPLLALAPFAGRSGRLGVWRG